MKNKRGFQGLKGKVRDVIRVFILIFHNTMERWKITQEVLAARSYRGKFYYGEASYGFAKRSCIMIMGYNVVLIILAIGIRIL